MRALFSGLITSLALTMSPLAHAATYFAVQTDITGAQTQIDVGHSTTWTFTTGAAWNFGGGTFVMKEGPSTSADVTLSIYRGINTSGILLSSITLTNALFCSQNIHCQQFNDVDFLYGAPIGLATQTTYHIILTSNALDQGSRQYFIKGASSALNFVDSNGSSIPTEWFAMGLLPPPGGGNGSSNDTGPVAPPPFGIPTPSAGGMLVVGLASLAFARLRVCRSLCLRQPAAPTRSKQDALLGVPIG